MTFCKQKSIHKNTEKSTVQETIMIEKNFFKRLVKLKEITKLT